MKDGDANDRPVGMSEASASALAGISPNRFVYFESDVDGVLYAVALQPPEAVAGWKVTRVDPDGARHPEEFSVHGLFHQDVSNFRATWYADYSRSGTSLEFVLPDGVTFQVPASRYALAEVACDSIFDDPDDASSTGTPCSNPAEWRVTFRGGALSECDHGLTDCPTCEVTMVKCDACREAAQQAFGTRDASALPL